MNQNLLINDENAMTTHLVQQQILDIPIVASSETDGAYTKMFRDVFHC